MTAYAVKLVRTLYGRPGIHAGVLEDPWCPTCPKDDNLEIEDLILHSLYSCRDSYRSLSDYFFETIPTGTKLILGVTTSKINQAKQTGCLLTGLINNYTAHIITTKRANKSLVTEIILKEIIITANTQLYSLKSPNQPPTKSFYYLQS